MSYHKPIRDVRSVFRERCEWRAWQMRVTMMMTRRISAMKPQTGATTRMIVSSFLRRKLLSVPLPMSRAPMSPSRGTLVNDGCGKNSSLNADAVRF